jgi:hypothetical protein
LAESDTSVSEHQPPASKLKKIPMFFSFFLTMQGQGGHGMLNKEQL